MGYKSFLNSDGKLRKVWDDTLELEADIKNNIEKVELDYFSRNSFKGFEILELASDFLIEEGVVYSFEIFQFPERFVHYANPLVIFNLGKAYDLQKAQNTISLGSDPIGTFSLQGDYHSWWSKSDRNDNRMVFNIQPDIFSQIIASDSQGAKLPIKMNASLYLLSPRVLNETQTGRE